MNSLMRKLSLAVLTLPPGLVFCQDPDKEAKTEQLDSTASGSYGGNEYRRTLDDFRVKQSTKDNPDSNDSNGGMESADASASSGELSSGYGGMAGPTAGSGDEGADGAAMDAENNSDQSDKQLLAQWIKQLRWQLTSNKFPREKVQRQLRLALQEYFDSDMRQRVGELDRVKARVTEMETKLQQRLDNEKDIVELQIKQMIHRADGLDFAVPGESNAGNGAMPGMDGGASGMAGGGYPGAGGSSGGGYPGAGGMPGGGYPGGGAGGGYPGATGGRPTIGMATSPFAIQSMGYDISFGVTRFQRVSQSDLDETDPLKGYSRFEPDQESQKPTQTDEEKLQRILLAFQEFESRFHHFPRSSNRTTKDQPPHSWRVAILPFIGDADLYREYKFDEPWNSPQNLRVAKKMPDLYRTAKAGSKDSTQFMMVVGGGAFDSAKVPPRMIDITDGTSNTIALIEAKEAVQWTIPKDFSYSSNAPLPNLSESRLIGLVDGNIRHLNNVRDNEFRALITRAMGDVAPE